ncbi:MAG: DUF4194 domain-containing protein [Saprospiraceae bacterium]|nr:DUF4194 domain-containing protein [Saprospiraceae bacterium]
MLLHQYNISPYAKPAAKLLQGALFEDQAEAWELLLQHQTELTAYFEQIALELIVDTRDGYAYLRQIELDDKGATIGLVRRMPLTYEQTLVCVFLREWLDDFESGNDLDSRNLYITPRAFRERLELFFKEKPNEVKFIRELDRYIADTERMGFLRLAEKHPANPDESQYEVRRLLKARVTNDDLARFREQLEQDKP